jgi:site-specific DNA-methyltransferase (adenine-specific)
MLDVLDQLEPNSIDAVVTDPPYEINFMNKGWDNTGIVFQKETWEKVLRVLKHGGHLLAFNHSRTFHRMAVAIEDAGFQIRDTIMWLYGSGFPKSHDVSKAIDRQAGAEREVVGSKKLGGNAAQSTKEKGGTYASNTNSIGVLPIDVDITAPATDEAKQWEGWGSALKPSYEPIILARKPLDGTIADNTLKYSVGGLNIDECRVGTEEISTHNAPKGTFAGGEYDRGSDTESYKSHIGRFPANTIHDGSDEVVDLFPETNASQSSLRGLQHSGRHGGLSDLGKNIKENTNTIRGHDDEGGSAARFFYTAKASKKDRDEGLDIEPKYTAAAEFRPNHMEKAVQGDSGNPYGRWQPRKNIHPTVKPTELMQYLIRLITPKGGTVLDPFMGSGSTGKAAMIENNERNAEYYFVGIDINPEYIDIAAARIDYGINYKENKADEEEKQIVGDSQLKLEL